MLGKLGFEFSRWRAAIRAHFDPAQPPVIGWQVPFLGCGLGFGLGGPRWLHDQHARLGSPFTLYMKGQRFTISQDPEFMRHFYTAGVDDVSFFEGLATFPGFSELIAMGMSGPEGANVGMDVVRKFLPARTSKASAELDEELTISLSESLASGRADLLSTMRRAILRMSALLIVGPGLARDRIFIDTFGVFDDAMLGLVASLSTTRSVRRGLAARTQAVERILVELERRRREPNSGDPRDVADAMLIAQQSNGELLTNEVIAMELFGYMFGALANTHTAATMCVMQIVTNPALRRRVEDEQRACRAAHGPVLSPASLKDMPVLNACYQETLRFYVAPMHVRLVLKPLQIGQYTLPERSMIAFSPYLLQRDPSVYTDPDVFDPDRFLAGPRGPAKAPSVSHYLPYGRGIHTCLGRHLARQEIMLGVARLLRDFEVELAPCKDPLAANWITNGIAAPAGPRTIVARARA
jgi:sterol 14-demethylase